MMYRLCQVLMSSVLPVEMVSIRVPVEMQRAVVKPVVKAVESRCMTVQKVVNLIMDVLAVGHVASNSLVMVHMLVAFVVKE